MKPTYQLHAADLYAGDCLEVLAALPAASVRTCVTSPPYFGLRDYGMAGQIGREPTLGEYIARLVSVFDRVRRVLCDDGTLWLNLGDKYGVGKSLLGAPWRAAFALQEAGWFLRQDIIWHKPNPMPESVRDRCTKAHEYLFLLSKSARYLFDADAIKEPAIRVGAVPGGQKYMSCNSTGIERTPASDGAAGNLSRPHSKKSLGIAPVAACRNKRSVWTVSPKGFKGAHFAVMPESLVEPCILAGSAAGDAVLDPFCGSGTTGAVSLRHGRRFIGIDLNPEYLELTRSRLSPRLAG